MSTFIVVEFHGTGDPMFGGAADDRPLGVSGSFENSWGRGATRAHFETRAAAIAAGEAAANRRERGVLGAFACPGCATCPAA